MPQVQRAVHCHCVITQCLNLQYFKTSINKRHSSSLCVLILNLNINPLTSMHVIMKYCKKSLFLYIVTPVSLSISFHCWRQDPRSSTNCLGTYQITECIMDMWDHTIITKPCVIGKIWMHFRKQRIRLNVIQYSACVHNFLCLSVLWLKHILN